jgi:hypothetical protein
VYAQIHHQLLKKIQIMLFSSRILLFGYTSSFAAAFAPGTQFQRTSTSLDVAVDPTVVTKKEYQDICGVDFDNYNLGQRLERTKFLYPKHVEVISDFDDVVSQSVDEIVSNVSLDKPLISGSR